MRKKTTYIITIPDESIRIITNTIKNAYRKVAGFDIKYPNSDIEVTMNHLHKRVKRKWRKKVKIFYGN